ncbi:hypothetical protein MVEN_01424500 [Mycena venus]|uniref:Uncharacterized protein n=1 Tax=Mycena venus TaxID=2733690 RepID=A0A8H7CV06_9AGAR|nr:hypothetical protein MVEN_01424500 [Mycena venus]
MPDLDLFGGRPSNYLSVHGPALPSDDPDQIYDDFAGELARNRPSPKESDESDSGDDEDDYNPFREPESDGITPLEHPESDGLFHQYDSQIAEEQRDFAPDHSLLASGEDEWWCWRSKEECLLDIMSGFPRACFSEKELNATRWNLLTRSFVPSFTCIQRIAGERLEEARQAAKWKQEVDGNISGPMARGRGGKDYFVEEVCFAKLDGGMVGPVMPMRWFTRQGRMWSIAHPLRLTAAKSAFVIDGRESSCLEIPLDDYFLNVRDLEDPDVQVRYTIPPPSSIAGILRHASLPLEKWTQPSLNKWRVKGNGRRVHSVPLWKYCDDTSGNVSKKWNKHNSILFTLAGLPRELTQMIYNIHFIATSNLSPPLEMMEAVVAMLREAQKDGIEVWDCEYQEWILIIPWFLAFQGDNPMSSEFASHIGMKGKYFCRVCKAKSDKNNRPPGHAGEIDRLQEFMTAGTPRTKEQTVSDLTAQLKRAVDGAPSAVDDMATETGSKDKFFQHFVDKLQVAASKLRDEQKERGPGPSDTGVSKAEEVKNLLRQLRADMPDDIFNPVLSIPDFDAHRDTPVEILHVVLLGVVKYWWRDAVSRQNSKGKEELKARLSSMDVSGLNTPPIRGNTYVQYAGSLVGRDFRVILQVALVVLHGLIPNAHYDGWVSLCKLTPLMFQPTIDSLPAYLEKLDEAVLDFLIATALWNTQWFNKPKFHLFVHLTEHIRRFGPLILYATESFESFNLVIRLRSIHSTKHAPSLDIATAFSHLHAIRHLVSGGYVLEDVTGNSIPPRQAGSEVLALLKDDEFLGYMSMTGLTNASRSGLHMPLVGSAPCLWPNTAAGKNGIRSLVQENTKVQRCRNLILANGDKIAISKYLVYRRENCLHVGRIEEILVEPETDSILGILISRCQIGADIMPYRLPSCIVQENQHLVISFNELVCAINVNHNCAAHQCKMSLTRRVVQERQETDRFENELNHAVEPNDCFLNLTQLRSATHVQYFRSKTRFPDLSLVDAIEKAIENKERLEREAKGGSQGGSQGEAGSEREGKKYSEEGQLRGGGRGTCIDGRATGSKNGPPEETQKDGG